MPPEAAEVLNPRDRAARLHHVPCAARYTSAMIFIPCPSLEDAALGVEIVLNAALRWAATLSTVLIKGGRLIGADEDHQADVLIEGS